MDMEALGYLLFAAAAILFFVEAIAPTGGLVGLIGIGALIAAGILLDVPVAVIVVLVVAIVAVGLLFGRKVMIAQKQEQRHDRLGGADGPDRRRPRRAQPGRPGLRAGRPVEGPGRW